MRENGRNRAETLEKLATLSLTVSRKYANILASEGVVGDFIFHSKNVIESYNIKESENIKFSLFLVEGCRNVWDVSFWGQDLENSYESTATGFHAKQIFFCVDSWNNVRDLFYCINCYPNVTDCFGCVGLRNKSFCIFNKQYSKEEYNALVPKIIEHMKESGEWGEFFPAKMSPLGYNEVDIMTEKPLSREQALAR